MERGRLFESTTQINKRFFFALGFIFIIFYALHGNETLNRLPDYDEGIYVLHANRIASGQRPLIDFFHHQPPLYIVLCSVVFKSDGESVQKGFQTMRAVSMFSIFLCGLLIAIGLARSKREQAGYLAFSFFLVFNAAINSYGAMPTALSLLFLVGAWGAALHSSRFMLVVSGLFAAVALWVKVACLPALIGLILYLYYRHRNHRHLWWLWIFVFLSANPVLMGLFSLYTDFALPTLFLDQFLRVSEHSGFDVMLELPFFQDKIGLARGGSRLLFSAFTFAGFAILVFVPLALAIVSISLMIWRKQKRIWIPIVCFLLPVTLFHFFIWDLPWMHYLSVLLTGLIVPAALLLDDIIRGSLPKQWSHIKYSYSLVVLISALSMNVFCTSDFDGPGRYRQEVEMVQKTKNTLTFDPVLNVATNTKPACNMDDPLNTYQHHSLIQLLGTNSRFNRFMITDKALLDCLSSPPEKNVFWGYWMDQMASDTLLKGIVQLAESGTINIQYAKEQYRTRAESLRKEM